MSSNFKKPMQTKSSMSSKSLMGVSGRSISGNRRNYGQRQNTDNDNAMAMHSDNSCIDRDSHIDDNHS